MEKIITLTSGATLDVTTLPAFEVSDALYKAFLKDVLLPVAPDRDIDQSLLKDFFCRGFTSEDVKKALWKCMEKALYNGQKITKDTFEAEEARQDYIDVCYHVLVRNIEPFMKGLFARLSQPLVDEKISQA